MDNSTIGQDMANDLSIVRDDVQETSLTSRVGFWAMRSGLKEPLSMESLKLSAKKDFFKSMGLCAVGSAAYWLGSQVHALELAVGMKQLLEFVGMGCGGLAACFGFAMGFVGLWWRLELSGKDAEEVLALCLAHPELEAYRARVAEQKRDFFLYDLNLMRSHVEAMKKARIKQATSLSRGELVSGQDGSCEIEVARVQTQEDVKEPRSGRIANTRALRAANSVEREDFR